MAEGSDAPKGTGLEPYVLALVICDAIHVDPGTGKRTILGCFSAIHTRGFPTVHPHMAIYVALTDARGKIPITLRIVDVDEKTDPVFEAEAELEFPDPRTILECDFHVGNVVFPSPGEYRLQLYCRNAPLMERRIVVIGHPEQSDDATQES